MTALIWTHAVNSAADVARTISQLIPTSFIGNDWFAIVSQGSRSDLNICLHHSIELLAFSVSNICFSADGKYVASCSQNWDNFCTQVFEVQSGDEVAELYLPSPKYEDLAVCSVGFRANCCFLAMGGKSGAISILNVFKSEIRLWLEGHLKNILSMALSQDCTLLVSGSRDGVVRLWDCRLGRRLQHWLIVGTYPYGTRMRAVFCIYSAPTRTT